MHLCDMGGPGSATTANHIGPLLQPSGSMFGVFFGIKVRSEIEESVGWFFSI